MQLSPNARECRINPMCAVEPHDVTLWPSSLLCVTLDPVLCVLLKLLAVLTILVGDGRFDRIVWIRLNQKRLDEAQNRHDFVRRLPLIGTEQTKTHGALIVVAHIWVVDLGSEADNWWLEGVFVGERNLELEVTALHNVNSRSVPFNIIAGILEHTA
jgi:hypothetical protein